MSAPHTQPEIWPTWRLLASYIHEGIKLDLYGALDEDGYEVMDIALAGSNVSLFELVPVAFLERLTAWCNDKLPTGAELRRQARGEVRLENHLLDQAFA